MRERKKIKSTIFKDVLAERKKNAAERKEHVVAKMEMPEKENIIDEDAVLNQFEPYDKDKDNWVGSKDYWKCIFENETNRDPELHKKFGKLHTDIVEMVIKFCEENGLEDVDDFTVSADGLKDSYGYHEWTPGTDSCMHMGKIKEGDNGWWEREKGDFLYEI